MHDLAGCADRGGGRHAVQHDGEQARAVHDFRQAELRPVARKAGVCQGCQHPGAVAGSRHAEVARSAGGSGKLHAVHASDVLPG